MVSWIWCVHSFAASALAARPQAFAEIEQDVGGLADDHLAVAQEGRGEGGGGDVHIVPQAHQRPRAVVARHVYIVGAGFLQRQADEFAAPLDTGPIVEFIDHGSSLPRSRRPA